MATDSAWVAMSGMGTVLAALVATLSFIWSLRIHKEVRTPKTTTLAHEVETIASQTASDTVSLMDVDFDSITQFIDLATSSVNMEPLEAVNILRDLSDYCTREAASREQDLEPEGWRE